MVKVPSPLIVFAAAATVSGLCSGLSVIIQPLGAILPGVFFGVAISVATDHSLRSLATGKRAVIIGCTTFAYIVAIVVALLSMRLPGFDNGISSGAVSGILAGGTGALVTVLGLATAVSNFRSVGAVVVSIFAGCVFGAIFCVVGAYISDRTSLGHPFDDIVVFPLWQIGVASVLGLFAKGK